MRQPAIHTILIQKLSKRLTRRKRKAVCWIGGIFGVLIALQFLFVWNTTASLPVGLYVKTHSKRISRGDLVSVCPPDQPVFREAQRRNWLSCGLCPSGIGKLVKQVAALEGDRVVIDASGVTVNGQRYPNSRRILRIGDLRVPFTRTLEADEVLLMTTHPRSFDGRYFGIQKTDCILTGVKPVFTWVKEES